MKQADIIRKWFPFLNSWPKEDEPKMMKAINKRKKELVEQLTSPPLNKR